jgi:flagellar biosynthesis/type III secretory pathway protein FliH
MSSAIASRGGLSSLYAAMLPPSPPREPAIDIDAIAADAYRAGLAAGMAEAATELVPVRAAMTAAAAAFITAMTVDHDAVRGVFVRLVTTLAETVVAAELRIDPRLMPRLVDAALAGVVRDGLVVRVRPDDVAALDLDLPFVADPALARGSVSIDGPGLVIRDGLDTRLAALLEGLA